MGLPPAHFSAVKEPNEDAQQLQLLQINGGVGRIHGEQGKAGMQLQALDRKLAVHLGNDDVTVRGLFGEVNHHDVAVTESQLLMLVPLARAQNVETHRWMQSSLRSSSLST